MLDARTMTRAVKRAVIILVLCNLVSAMAVITSVVAAQSIAKKYDQAVAASRSTGEDLMVCLDRQSECMRMVDECRRKGTR